MARDAARNRHEADLTVDANLNAGRMRRILPWIALVLMAFLVAELLPGSAPISQPVRWPFLLVIYHTNAPQPWLVLVVTCITSLVWHTEPGDRVATPTGRNKLILAKRFRPHRAIELR